MPRYVKEQRKLVDAGIQLHTPPDLVPATQYTRLNNVLPKSEGELRTRDGLASIATILASTEVHSIFRLNQEFPSVTAERIIGVGTRLFTAPLPAGTVFTEQTGLTFDGGRLSIIDFRFTLDEAAWAIIANANGMRKRRDGFYQKLGQPAPTVAAVATDGGAGNLDSSGGTEYDWRYTYLNEITNTEGNPSPENIGGGNQEELRPSASTNPATGGDSSFASPGNAFDDNTGTSSDGNRTADPAGTTSCLWRTWAAPALTYGTLQLKIDSEIVVNSGSVGTILVFVEYSIDGGSSWKTVYVAANSARSRRTDVVNLAASMDVVNDLQVRARMLGTVKSGSDLDIDLKVYEIFTLGDDGTTATLALVSKRADVCVSPPTDTQQTAIRLYRRGGSLPNTWNRVGTFPVSTLVIGGCGAGLLEIEDNIADTNLGSSIELDNDEPVSSVATSNQPLPRIWGQSDERVLGCGDPNRPESVYFSKRGNADAWPPQNHVEVSTPGDPMQNGVVYNNRTFAFSHERMFELVPNIQAGVTFTPFPTPCGRGLIAPFGLAVSRAIYFVAKDGVFMTTGGPEQSLVDNDIQPLFPTQSGPGRDVGGYEAIDFTELDSITLEWHNDELYFTYKGVTSGDRQTLIYDLIRRRWRAATWSPEIVTVYSEGATVSSLLAGGATGLYYNANGNDDQGTAITASLRTGSHDQGQPLNTKQYGVLLVDCDPGDATIIVTPFINGEDSSLAPTNLTGSGRQTFTVDLLETEARNISFDFSWVKTSAQTPILFQYEILYFMLPVATKHWASDETSFGLQGWLHLRDLYVTIRSTADVTLTLDFDGTTQTYTIASTAGVRKKVYVQLAPNKGKLYKFEFNSSADFNLFEAASEVRVKQWLTSLGYAVVKPFGGEQLERTIAV